MSTMQDVDCTQRHQSAYKVGRPQTWKETFRKRCLERLRESRSKFVSSKRKGLASCELDNKDEDTKSKRKFSESIGTTARETKDAPDTLMDIQDIMKEEWDQMQRETKADKENVTEDCPSSTIDEMISLFEEIQEDLREEEMRLLENQTMCDDYFNREEQELCHAIQRLHTVEIVCPVCEEHNLILNKAVLFCMCGLRIKLEQDCISLKNVQDNLKTGLDEHSNQCASKPSFSQADQFGLSNLIMSCQDCDFLFIVV